MNTYSIGKVSERVGLSIDTLRYYEQIGLLVDITRNESGHRCYDEDDLKWLDLLICLRTTGMSISDMQRFAELLRVGDESVRERIELLQKHRQHMLQMIAEIETKLAVVDGKISHYEAKERRLWNER